MDSKYSKEFYSLIFSLNSFLKLNFLFVSFKVLKNGTKRTREKENDFVMDIKTCQDASPTAFRKAIYYYSYHLYMYASSYIYLE